MVKGTSQLQIQRQLDKIERQVEGLESFKLEVLTLLKEIGYENYYPPESKFKKSSLKRLDKALANVKKGKVRHFKDFREFAMATG